MLKQWLPGARVERSILTGRWGRERQMFDLEVIKRKYANMMDILTYDDLLRRLSNIIASLTERKAAGETDISVPQSPGSDRSGQS